MIFEEIITLAELLLQTGYEQKLRRIKPVRLGGDRRMCETAHPGNIAAKRASATGKVD